MTDLSSSDIATLKAELLCIVRERSLILGKTMLSSGKEASYYVDGKMTTLSRDGIYLIAKILVGELDGIDAVGGPTLGADPFLGAVLYECYLRQRPMEAFIVRKEVKGHGTGKQIEGLLRPGMRVAIIEDVITTGGSIRSAIKAVEAMSCTVAKVLVLLDRLEGGSTSLREDGYHVVSLFTKDDLGVEL